MALVKLNNRGVRSATAFGSISALGEMRFIKKQTASSSATISFVDGTSDVVLDDTYKEYLFTFNNIHPATNETQFAFQVDTGTNTSYNQTITSSYFRSLHHEDDSTAALQYKGEQDQAQGTSFQKICINVGNENDESCSGTLHLFNPSSSTFVKHFIAHTNTYRGEDQSETGFLAGYVNTTTALTRVQFKMYSGNIDAGDICLYGIK
jgi:hypothetical protein